jgi:O-antigen/teichoic acid export membrane protein
MNKEYIFSRFINLFLRATSMFAKFLIIVYIGKYLGADALGEYGLFFSTITIAIFFLGMDFYTFNTREIIKHEHNYRFKLIRDQWIFHLLNYIVILPLLLVVFFFDIIPYKYLFIFYLLLVLEHMSQELYRLYTTLGMPIFANILLFFRTSLWVYIITILWVYDMENIKNLYSIYVAWVIGAFISVVIGFIYLFKLYDKNDLKTKIDWQWVIKGFKISMPFFASTIAFKVIGFTDRYMIDYYMTKNDVGVYTFLSSIANTTQTIVFTVVIMVYYPKLIELYQKNKYIDFEIISRKFLLEVIIYSFAVIIIIIIIINPILIYMNRVEFSQSITVLWILLFGALVINVSFVFHYILFAKQLDKVIRDITIIGAFLNVGLNIFMIKYYGLVGASISTVVSFCAILILKYKATFKKNNEEYYYE